MHTHRTSQSDLTERLIKAIKDPPVDISVGSDWHRNSFTAAQLKVCLGRNACNFCMHEHRHRHVMFEQLTGPMQEDGIELITHEARASHLYTEVFDVPTSTSDVVKEETEKKKEE